MARREFSKPTKREALRRSGFLCEAVGEWYGLLPGQRCNAPLSSGVEFDHIDLDANSKDNSLSNCAAICIPCHRVKTFGHDIPVAAKTIRQQDRHLGINAKPKGRPMPGTKASGIRKKLNGSVEWRNSAVWQPLGGEHD